MKLFTHSLVALGLLTSSLIADDKDAIQAKLISTTISHGLPEGLSFRDRPFSFSEGASLVFFFQAENIVDIDKESFFVEGWDKNFRSQISHSGKTGSITIYNKKFKGIFEELEADGRVDVIVGTAPVTKNVVLKKGAEPIKYPTFTMQLELDEENKNAFSRNGVKIEGKHKMIKSLCLIRDGKEITSNGYNSSGNSKTFRFREIKDADEVKIIYWSKLKSRSVKLYK